MPINEGTTPYSLFEEKLKLKVPLQPENILGRESGLKTETMSRRHCQIVTKENRWFLADLASTNGTFLNGKKMKPREWYSMKVGDEIEFGSLVFKFTGPPARAEANIEAPRAETVSMTQPRDGAATSRMKVPVPDRRGAGAPTAAPEAGSVPENPQSKGFWIRFAAMAIDTFALLLICFIVQAIIQVPFVYAHFTYLAAMIPVIVLPLKLSGQTLGKMMMGLQVTGADGAAVSLKQILLRELIGKFLLLTLVPLVGALFLIKVHIAAALGLIVAVLAGFAFLYKRRGEAFWDLMFRTRVTGTSLSKNED